MRRLTITLGAVAFCLSALGVIYAAQQSLENKNGSTINLYQLPEQKSTVLQKLPLHKQLILIYYKNGWIKVGDPHNGQVGWVDREQYCKAIENYYQPDIQTVFIHTERNDKGNPVVDVMAYKNGKKLSDKKARQLYQDIEKQLVQESHYVHQSFWYVHRMITEQMCEMSHLMDPLSNEINEVFDFEPAVIQPIVILSHSQDLQTRSMDKDSLK